MTHKDWSQLRELRDLQERMNHFFRDTRAQNTPTSEGEWAQEGEWYPATDIYEQEGEIVLKMDLPEIEQSAIKLTVDGNRLVISGERRPSSDVKRESYVRIERQYGEFTRSFALPDTVDRERIEASCEKGALTVRLPRRTEKQPRVIIIDVK
ncbi:MAG: Hsp20/alpha crystallin family protein [Acidobacteriota bacterium]